ncbi:sodium:proton antiporter [Pendulispora rubella]|uniref:Sodium:proton antiporter n=1 Tax=Pendulispora rubella TaxID=2741070 RepID=A0ABZ2L7C0_9BACT
MALRFVEYPARTDLPHMPFELLFVALFSIATAVALAARWLRAPYTVALVAAGVLLGSVQAFEPPHLTKDLLYTVFLPGLLFEAAFHLEFRKFWQNKLAILALAVPGVIAAIAITAVILAPVANALHVVEHFTLLHALVFAAILAATDPIAVVALFKSLGAPKRLMILVEGESLLNDGTSVVFFTLISGIAVTGAEASVFGSLMDFLRVVGMGALIGVMVSFAVSKVIQQVEDAMIEITLTTIAAYGSFALAEQFHFSGVIATVTAGMVCGNYAARTGMGPTTRIAVESFWEYVAFALNSIVFLLIGFEVRLSALLASWKPILAAYLSVTIARAVLTYGVTFLLRSTKERIPWSWSAILTWGGLRGGLSMVLVLALPATFPHRELLITMTFGVVLISIVLQGLTIGPLMRRLKIVGVQHDRIAYDKERGVLRAAKAALETLESMKVQGAVHADVENDIRSDYERMAHDAEARIQSLYMDAAELRNQALIATKRHLLMIEKDAILDAVKRGLLGNEAAEELLHDIDARLFGIEDP